MEPSDLACDLINIARYAAEVAVGTLCEVFVPMLYLSSGTALTNKKGN